MELNVNFDQSERITYNQTGFPVFVHREFLSTYPNYAAISHWHDDLEFIYIISGQMHYRINGKQILLRAGEGLFVNTRQFHYGFSPDHQECDFICILFHPLLLCSSASVEQQFVLPVLQNECFPYLVLRGMNEQEQKILLTLQEIWDCALANPFAGTFALKTQALLFQLWENLFSLSGHTEKNQAPGNQHLTILKDMIRFISSHYTEKISLAEISRAGTISKTTCSHIFVQYTNQTPFSYLTEYRLKKSAELLRTTDRTISEICFEVGFSGASYFAETFKKSYRCTPGEYRRQKA
ncbi:MAG: AraC family transcriptional regulator [Lachnospiraceae bacterium]|nr:AraC family transcriptional regulator [Lachnospiraceae bacterium]